MSAQPTTYRVTHVDTQGQRRTTVLACTLRSAAEALALAMWGDALYLAAVRLAGATATACEAGPA